MEYLKSYNEFLNEQFNIKDIFLKILLPSALITGGISLLINLINKPKYRNVNQEQDKLRALWRKYGYTQEELIKMNDMYTKDDTEGKKVFDNIMELSNKYQKENDKEKKDKYWNEMMELDKKIDKIRERVWKKEGIDIKKYNKFSDESSALFFYKAYHN